MFTDVAVHLLPIVLIVANLLAIRTNREQPLELLYSRERHFKVGDAIYQIPLKLADSQTYGNARLKLLPIEGFRHVVVSTCFEALHNVYLFALGRQKDQVGRLRALNGSRSTAYLDAIEAGHHPVQDRNRGRVALQRFPSLVAVGSDSYFISRFDK